MMFVAGADGCRGGWLCVLLDAEHTLTNPRALRMEICV